MKLQQRFLSILTILSLAVFSNCSSDGGNETPPEKVALGNLSKTWNIVSADRDGTAANEADDFTNFKLTISGDFVSATPEGPYDYSVSGSQPILSPWPQTPDGNGGTWTFGATPEAKSGLIARDDGTAMTYVIDDTGKLTLTFNFSGLGYPAAKAAQVTGNWTFVFNPAP